MARALLRISLTSRPDFAIDLFNKTILSGGNLAALSSAAHGHHAISCTHRDSREAKDLFTVSSQRDMRAIALEQCDAEILLELAQLNAQRGLSD